MYALPVAGLFVVLASYQVIMLTEPYTLYSTDGYRSLSSKIVPTHREISSQCLFSTPRFQGIKVYSLLNVTNCGGKSVNRGVETGSIGGIDVSTS